MYGVEYSFVGFMILRDYQEEIKERVYAAWEAGCRSVMCQMPTGTGKTVVLSQIVHDNLRSEKREVKSEKCAGAMRVLVVAHRKEILEQINETLRKYGLGDALADGSVVVESIQKLTNNNNISFLSLLTGEDAQRAGEGLLVLIDEAHHCTAKTYRMLWEMFPKARFLGMTATPCRLKQEGFTELFEKLICSEQIAKFIHDGWLANYEFISIRTDCETQRMISGLKKRAVDGDYQTKEMEEVLGTRASIEQLYRSYKQYAEGKKGIIYAINREHASHIASFYEEMMLCEVEREERKAMSGERRVMSPVAVVDSTTPKKERERINKEYREGKIRILVNCEIYGEGYDVKDVEFIQLARPTLSLTKYLQQVGRGLRPNKDGEQTVILDNVGMYYRFGLPHENRDWERMFRYGQMDYTHEMKMRISEQETKTKTKTKTKTGTGNIADGHNLEMMTIVDANEVQEALDIKYGKTEIFEYNGKFGLRRGKTIMLIPMHDKIGPFVGGYALVDERFFVSEYGETYTLNNMERACEKYEGGFIHRQGGDYSDLIYAGSYRELPKEVIMFEGFIPLVRIGDLYCLRTKAKEIAFRKEDLWIKGNGFQRKNALNPNQSIYMNRLTGEKVFVFVGFYPDGVKKIRDYEGGKYYRVEQGGVPVWDGEPIVPIDGQRLR